MNSLPSGLEYAPKASDVGNFGSTTGLGCARILLGFVTRNSQQTLMNRSLYSVLLLLALTWTDTRLCQAYSTSLHVKAWTTKGERIDKIWIVLSSLNGQKKYTANGHDVQLSIETGEYELEVAAPGFRSNRQLFRAYTPTVFRSVALGVAWVHGQDLPGLEGTVRNYAGDMRTLRVRLTGLYGGDVWEAIPDKHGLFHFPADEGVYQLLTVADVEKGLIILDSRHLIIPYSEVQNVVIDLERNNGTLIRLDPKFQ